MGRKYHFRNLPHIGENYPLKELNSDEKILFVGLEAGKDPRHIESLTERRASIGGKNPVKHNTHITGTYIQSLHLLNKYQPGFACDSAWEEIVKDARVAENGLEAVEEVLPDSNPLSFITLTNRYKFVPKGSDKHTNKEARFMDSEQEQLRLLQKEVSTLTPTIVVIQGNASGTSFVKEAIRNADHEPNELLFFWHPGTYNYGSASKNDIPPLVKNRDW